MSDLDRYIKEQCARSPEFKKAYDEGKALEAKARRLEPILREAGFKILNWFTILAVLEAASDLDSETEAPKDG